MDSRLMQISKEDLTKLEQAVVLLESPTLTAQITNLLGKVVKIDLLPNYIQGKIVGIAEQALDTIFNVASSTMEDKQKASSPLLHKLAAAATGGAGGFFGMTAILVEMPISITIMMRSILDIAREEGFSLRSYETRMECIKVFGLGSNLSQDDDESESGYFLSRVALDRITQSLSKTAMEIAAKDIGVKQFATTNIPSQIIEPVSKAMIKLIQAVAQRFGIVLTEEAAAKLVPGLGAVTGSMLNTMFVDYYQDMAKGHFMVKKLEQKYSEELIKTEYQRIYKQQKYQNK
ncbi:EcsC family protein [Pelistega sp. NLN82]|uniref:EcsC family protein n=1 Tax=Pelistega ratti TaxID=2652177 RepID=A0A6L9Y478_9BURK|nr:EcsC family protein [Pelistega ratti]NEN74985.1 EcsC family protein [Pelistega ratti]